MLAAGGTGRAMGLRGTFLWLKDLVGTLLERPDELMLELGAGGELLVARLRALLSLTALLILVQRDKPGPRLPSARLYRLLELIGRWSMLDVYVVAILVALVQAQSLATMAPGPGVLAFAAVVVLSMLATMAFDPRLIWDRVQNEEIRLESN